jgi:hypothetical protein
MAPNHRNVLKSNNTANINNRRNAHNIREHDVIPVYQLET